MAITFKYGAPGPILQAGFAAGVGNRLKRQQDDALEIWERQNQQQFQAEQAAIGRQFQFGLQQQQFGQQLELQGRAFDQRSLEDQQQRAFQAEQAGLGRDFQAEQNKALIDARAAEAGREREHDFELASRRNDYNIQAGLRSGELELPPEAHRRLDQLESGRVYAMTLDPAQEKEFMEQYESEKRELLGLAQPARQPSIEEQFAQNTFESGGTLYQRGKDGGFDVLREAPEDPSQQFNDAVVKRYETLRKQKNEDGEMISDEQAQRQAISDEMATAQFRQRLSGSQTGLPSPTQPQTAPGIAGPVAELPDQSRRQQASPPKQQPPAANPDDEYNALVAHYQSLGVFTDQEAKLNAQAVMRGRYPGWSSLQAAPPTPEELRGAQLAPQQPVAQTQPQQEPMREPNDGMVFDAYYSDWREATNEEWKHQAEFLKSKGVKSNYPGDQPAETQLTRTIKTAQRVGFQFVQNDEEAAKLPKGTRVIRPDGRTGIVK